MPDFGKLVTVTIEIPEQLVDDVKDSDATREEHVALCVRIRYYAKRAADAQESLDALRTQVFGLQPTNGQEPRARTARVARGR